MYIPTDLITRIQNDPMAKKKSLWVFQIFGILLMVFIPENILTLSPVLATVVDVVANQIPSVGKWALHSSWPEVTKLFFVYCWLTLPIQVIIITKYLLRQQLNPKATLVKRWIGISIFMLLSMSCLLLNYYYAIPYTESLGLFEIDPYRSKVVQAIFGVIMVFVNAWFVSMNILIIKNIKMYLLNK